MTPGYFQNGLFCRSHFFLPFQRLFHDSLERHHPIQPDKKYKFFQRPVQVRPIEHRECHQLKKNKRLSEIAKHTDWQRYRPEFFTVLRKRIPPEQNVFGQPRYEEIF
jgi:hypothetical protein